MPGWKKTHDGRYIWGEDNVKDDHHAMVLVVQKTHILFLRPSGAERNKILEKVDKGTGFDFDEGQKKIIRIPYKSFITKAGNTSGNVNNESLHCDLPNKPILITQFIYLIKSYYPFSKDILQNLFQYLKLPWPNLFLIALEKKKDIYKRVVVANFFKKINLLPELSSHVFAYLDEKDVKNLRLVCKAVNEDIKFKTELEEENFIASQFKI